MEKKLWVLLLLVLLSGCARNAPAADGNAADGVLPAQETAAPQTEAADTAENRADAMEDVSAIQVELDARPVTEEEVLEAYDRAAEAYGWFELAPLTSGEETVTLDGCVYSRVTARGMETMEDLRVYLRSLFSAELTERLLATGDDCPLYREIDGALYVTSGGRSRDPYRGATEVEAQQDGDTGYLVNVSVELLDEDLSSVTGLECWSFPYSYVDGRWVFTDFRLVC